LEVRHQSFQDIRLVSARHHPWHVLHDEISRLQFEDEAPKLEDEGVPNIIERSFTD